ncbi:pathogen-related protein-like [Sesamum indicum]|uniref:Pathogen-related protein-like n=1 Tax=Sesamum indicum TaxID=4182 RepID=A0A6I9TE69_SESIN|nr:pathogen-related protein-like [Sesamum indicum]
MATQTLQGALKTAKDKYRSFLHHEDAHNTVWRRGAPPTYHNVNKLFEEGRTKEWAEGSLEETVQNMMKSWQTEFTHKTRTQDFRIMHPEKFKLIVNGREALSAEETISLGSYNSVLKSSMPDEFKYYKAHEETFDSADDAFRNALPRGFACEVVAVYSSPPVITFKFRHWGYFEGPFKGHAPTGEMVQLFGLVILKVDELMRAEEVEIYYDPAELFAPLLKAPLISGPNTEQQGAASSTSPQKCPFQN